MLIDDAILDHRKFVRAVRFGGSPAVHMWLGLMSYCRLQRTDGIVPLDVLPHINGPIGRWRARAIEALVDAELVDRGEGHLLLRGYLERNKSRADLESQSATRTAARKAGRAQAVTPGPASSDSRASVALEHGERKASANVASPVSNDNGELSGQNPTHALPSLDTSRHDPPVTPQAPSPETTRAAPAGGSTGSPRSGKRSAPRARTLCPTDLKPDPTTTETAWELGFTRQQLDAETVDFIDWWRSEARLKADWQATLRNRLRQRAEKLALRPRPPRDDKWAAHQRALKKANEPVTDGVKLPLNFGANVGAAHG